MSADFTFSQPCDTVKVKVTESGLTEHRSIILHMKEIKSCMSDHKPTFFSKSNQISKVISFRYLLPVMRGWGRAATGKEISPVFLFYLIRWTLQSVMKVTACCRVPSRPCRQLRCDMARFPFSVSEQFTETGRTARNV